MRTRTIISAVFMPVVLAYIIVMANISPAYGILVSTTAINPLQPVKQHMNVLVIADDNVDSSSSASGGDKCAADLIKKGMALPDPTGNSAYFPKHYDIHCLYGMQKRSSNTFQYIEDVLVPVLSKSAKVEQVRGIEGEEQLYLFVYPPSLEKQFQDYLTPRFGDRLAKTVSGWADVANNVAFSPIWAAIIYHEGRHLAIHGTWHDKEGNPFPDGKVHCFVPSSSSSSNSISLPDSRQQFHQPNPVVSGLLQFLNIPNNRLIGQQQQERSQCLADGNGF